LSFTRLKPELPDSRTQRRFGYILEILVSLHERSQPGLFQLPLPPQFGQGAKVARDAVAVAQDDGMHIE
jgi:hypothetical protein